MKRNVTPTTQLRLCFTSSASSVYQYQSATFYRNRQQKVYEREISIILIKPPAAFTKEILVSWLSIRIFLYSKANTLPTSYNIVSLITVILSSFIVLYKQPTSSVCFTKRNLFCFFEETIRTRERIKQRAKK